MIKTLQLLLIGLTMMLFPNNKEKPLTSLTPEKEIVWKVTEPEANTIITALNELPAKVANPLIQKLILQANQQYRVDDSLQKQKALQDSLDKIKSKRN